ncbi:MAG: C1 family peptidase, partial [Candidatus Auribacterota bacterium]|nr:C1 family peptidase [Candidatus Auribacterota bacterium]
NRDVPMSLVLPRISAPTTVDYTNLMSPVRNQGEEGTCVAFASVVGIKEFQEKEEHRRLIELSPRYIYHLCKEVDGIPDQEGTYTRIAMKALAEQGVCTEGCWPYQPYQSDKACPEADEQARPFRIKTYARLTEIDEMERSLSINGPFMAGIEVFSAWFEDQQGKIPLPSPGESSLGGHAVCVVGYSREGSYFKFKNSWGVDWGDRGYGYLPYEYMIRHSLDAWSATDLLANPDLVAQERGVNDKQ